MQAVVGFLNKGKGSIHFHLSDSERQQAIRSLEYLETLEEQFFLPAAIVWHNINDYRQMSSWIAKSGREGLSQMKLNDGIFKMEIARRISNILTSFRSYLDVTAAHLSAFHKPSLGQIFKKEQSTSFDNSFPYRFLYKLRNYCQHFSFPFASVQMSDSFVEEGKFLFDLTLSKTKLMRYDSWGSVKKDLENQPLEISIHPLLDQLMIEITRLQRAILIPQVEEIRADSNIIFKIFAKVSAHGNAPFVGWPKLDAAGNHNMQLETRFIPSPFLDTLEKFLATC